jgi:hypothetical protein
MVSIIEAITKSGQGLILHGPRFFDSSLNFTGLKILRMKLSELSLL